MIDLSVTLLLEKKYCACKIYDDQGVFVGVNIKSESDLDVYVLIKHLNGKCRSSYKQVSVKYVVPRSTVSMSI